MAEVIRTRGQPLEEVARAEDATTGALHARNLLQDTALVCHQLADVEIAPDLVAEVHRQSKGLMRPICNAIAAIEAHAGRNKLAKVKLADLAGQELCHDWQSRRPQLVRVAAGGR